MYARPLIKSGRWTRIRELRMLWRILQEHSGPSSALQKSRISVPSLTFNLGLCLAKNELQHFSAFQRSIWKQWSRKLFPTTTKISDTGLRLLLGIYMPMSLWIPFSEANVENIYFRKALCYYPRQMFQMARFIAQKFPESTIWWWGEESEASIITSAAVIWVLDFYKILPLGSNCSLNCSLHHWHRVWVVSLQCFWASVLIGPVLR